MQILDKKIEYFIKVVDEGSFSAAARKLYLSQANLSKQIRQLEIELGIRLFDRSGYRPVLTSSGEYFYKNSTQLKKQADKLLEGLKQNLDNTIYVGFTGAFENREIIDAIRSFQDDYPDITVSIKQSDFSGCVQALLDEKLDVSFGLESTFRRYQKIKYDILHGYQMCLICSNNHPFAQLNSINVKQMQSQEMIILSKKFNTDFYQDFIDACKKDGFIPKIKKEVDTFDELVFSVSIGEGVAIAGRSVVRENEVKAIPIEYTHHFSNYVIAYLENQTSESVKLFLRYINTIFSSIT